MNYITIPTTQKRDWRPYINRQQATEVNNISIGKLLISDNDYSVSKGTAFQVHDNILMTAAHCVSKVSKDIDYAAYVEELIYLPNSLHGNQVIQICDVIIPDAYLSNPSIENDYAFLIAEKELPGLSLNIIPCSEVGVASSFGYPDSYNYYGDKLMSITSAYHQPYQEKFIMMDNDMTSGSSGGPIMTSYTEVVSLNSSMLKSMSGIMQMAGPMMREEIIAMLYFLKKDFNLK